MSRSRISAGLNLSSASHFIPAGNLAVGPTAMGLPRDILTVGSSFGSRLYRLSRSLRWVAMTFGLLATPRLEKVLKGHPRFHRAKGVTVEIETEKLSAILLITQSLRRGQRIAR